MTTATLESEIVTGAEGVADLLTIGGRYKWTLGADGKYAMIDVEMFSTHAKGENGVNVEVDDACLAEFYANMVAEFPKHALPVNIYHHDDKNYERPIRIGYVQPVGIKKIFVNAKYRNTIMVNVIGVAKNYFLEAQNVEFPYRSAEIGSFKARQFVALSMLKDEMGYFKYALLVPGEEVKSKMASCAMPENPTSPLMAYRASSDSDRLLFLYKFGGNVDQKKKEDAPKDSGDAGPDQKPGADGKPAFGEDKKNMAADPTKGGPPVAGGAPAAGADPSVAGDPQTAGLLAVLAKVWKEVQAIGKKLGTCPSADEQNGDKAPSQDDNAGNKDKSKKDSKYSAGKEEKAMSVVKEEEVKSADAKAAASADADRQKISDDAKYAAVQDENETLRGKLSAKDLEEKTVKELVGEGRRLTKFTRERIAHYAAKGEDALNDFVTDYRKIAVKDPPPSVDGGTVKSGAGDADAGLPQDDVLKYKASDPKEFALRKALTPEFAAYKAKGGEMTFDRYVAGEKMRTANGGR